MNYSKYRFNLDMQSYISQISLPVRQNDTGIVLRINLTDGGVPYTIKNGSMAMFFARKSDGNPLLNSCVIENNTTICYELTQQTTAHPGVVDCEIRLYGSDGNIITTPRFILVVDSRVVHDEDFPMSDSENDLLDNIIISESERVANEAARKETYDNLIGEMRENHEVMLATTETASSVATTLEQKLATGDYNGKDGYTPIKGVDYNDGLTPFIGDNGNWWIGENDTGAKAKDITKGYSRIASGTFTKTTSSERVSLTFDFVPNMVFISAEDIHTQIVLDVSTGRGFITMYSVANETLSTDRMYCSLSDTTVENISAYNDNPIYHGGKYHYVAIGSNLRTAKLLYYVGGEPEYHTVTAEEGTTWAEWCAKTNEEYTNAGYPMGDYWVNQLGYVYDSFSYYYVTDSNGNPVLWDSEIISGEYTGDYSVATITLSVDGSYYTAEKGSTWSKFASWHSGFVIDSRNDVRISSDGRHVYASNGSTCSGDDTIIPNEKYYTS